MAMDAQEIEKFEERFRGEATEFQSDLKPGNIKLPTVRCQ
jgi:hypothetical protein